jgi:hypothetical protein
MSVTPAPTFNIVESWVLVCVLEPQGFQGCVLVDAGQMDAAALVGELSKNLLLKLFLDGGGEVTPKIIITKAIVGPD